MNQKSLGLFVLLISFLLAGCAQPGRALVKSDKEGMERLTESSVSGQYVLYAEMDPTPEITCTLKKGDKLGFITENGKTWAVAGEKHVEISPKKQYLWKLQED